MNTFRVHLNESIFFQWVPLPKYNQQQQQQQQQQQKTAKNTSFWYILQNALLRGHIATLLVFEYFEFFALAVVCS